MNLHATSRPPADPVADPCITHLNAPAAMLGARMMVHLQENTVRDLMGIAAALPVTPHRAWREPKLHADDLVEDPRGAAYPDSVQTAIRNLAIPSGQLPDGQRAIPLADVPALLEAHAEWWQSRLQDLRHDEYRLMAEVAAVEIRLAASERSLKQEVAHANARAEVSHGRADAALHLAQRRHDTVRRVRTMIDNGGPFGARATVRAVREYLNARGVAPTPDADQ